MPHYTLSLFTWLVVALAVATGCFTSPPMAHTFEGRVIDQTGAPVAEVAVTILDGPGSFPDLASLTDSTGRFTLHELSAGTFTIYLMAPSGKSARRRISVGDRSGVVDVRLP